MERRAFGVALALAAIVRRGAAAQPLRKLFRVGILSLGPTSQQLGPDPLYAPTRALLRGLRELGYMYGEHFMTEARGGDGEPERFNTLATEFSRLGLDVIVAPGPMLPALKRATSTVPVVMAGALDPLGQGLVKSLARPGTNFTGFSLQSAEATAKRLELLKELVPTAKHRGPLGTNHSVPLAGSRSGRESAQLETIADRNSRRCGARSGDENGR